MIDCKKEVFDQKLKEVKKRIKLWKREQGTKVLLACYYTGHYFNSNYQSSIVFNDPNNKFFELETWLRHLAQKYDNAYVMPIFDHYQIEINNYGPSFKRDKQ